MTYKSLLTYSGILSSVEQLYYSPILVIPGQTDITFSSIYCFLSKVEPWDDDNDPPMPTQDQRYLKNVAKNIFAVKKLSSNNICPVTQRIDWTTGTSYDYYRDDVDMFELDQNGFFVKKFYVKNRYDQVFKCLWNNNGEPSTVEPYFEPGTYGTNNIFKGEDNYKWKYIYTIDSALKVNFMDESWMPVPVIGYTPSSTLNSAGAGNIDVINVLDGGLGYDPANATINVAITGDGTGAVAIAEITDGSILDIIVTNTGSNYTYANATIQTSIGSGASLIAPVSPIAGHGYDAVSELGCSHAMMTFTFEGTEGGLIPTDIDYHQIGILINPTTKESTPYSANGNIYKTTTDFIVAPGFGSYTGDEYVYQGSSLETATFSARVLSFDAASGVIMLINTIGTPITNATVYGNTSRTARTLLSYSEPNFITLSGYMSYIENRTGIQRSDDGIEQFKLVIGY